MTTSFWKRTSWYLGWGLPLVFLGAFLNVSASAAETWPQKDWEVAGANDTPVDAKALEEFYRVAFAREVDPADPKPLHTDAVLIVKSGRIVAERYYKDARPDYSYDAHSKHITWSATKSVVNALVGIAIREGRLGLHTPISAFYPELQRPGQRAITIKHALEFSTCLDWTESYEGNDLRVSSVIAMLYGPGHRDMASYVAGHEAACQAGLRWRYSSGDPLLTSGALKKVYADESSEYPWTHLFDRIGMKETTYEADMSGTFIGSSSIYSTARDLARFGLLYARQGKWRGEQILPEGWTDYSASPASAFLYTAVKNPATDWIGGASFWPNASLPAKDMTLRFPAVPEGAFIASGHWGQMIAIIPSKDMVVVRLGDDRDGRFNEGDNVNQFLKLAMSAVGEH